MSFMDKISRFFSTVCAKIKAFVLSHKKISLAVAIAVAVIIVALIVVFVFVKPKWDYSHKVVTTIDGKDYTQSDVDEIGDWWSEYIKGDNIYNEGNTPMEK